MYESSSSTEHFLHWHHAALIPHSHLLRLLRAAQFKTVPHYQWGFRCVQLMGGGLLCAMPATNLPCSPTLSSLTYNLLSSGIISSKKLTRSSAMTEVNTPTLLFGLIRESVRGLRNDKCYLRGHNYLLVTSK